MQHLDFFSRDTLLALVNSAKKPCITLYCPMVLKGKATEQNAIRFKNLLQSAEKQLRQAGYRDNQITMLLRPAKELIPDKSWWQQQNLGLAVFIAPDIFQTCRLPLEFDEQVLVSQRFHICPMLPYVAEKDRNFFILALTLRHLALYKSTPFDIQPLSSNHLPAGIEEMLRHVNMERQPQLHRGTGDGKGKRTTMFHGHGASADEALRKEEIIRYFQIVDRKVNELLRDKSAPLLPVGQEHLVSLYRQANSYAQLTPEAITKNPEALNESEIHRDALPLMRAYLENAKQRALQRYNENGKASKDLAEILHATTRNQVETLFVARGAEKWGEFNPATDQIIYHPTRQPQDVNLFDVAAEKAFLHNADVFIMDPTKMPGRHDIAAVFRFASA